MKHAMLLVILGILLSGCRKLMDSYYDYKSGNPPVNSSCRIDSIYAGSEAQYSVSAGIHYNAQGYPIAVNHTLNDNFPISFTVTYTYDEQHRLIYETPDFIYAGPKEVTYVYEGDSPLPVRDTIFELFVLVVEDLHYDIFGRIIKVVKHTMARLEDDPSVYPDQEFNYYYDIWGNRQEDSANENYPGVIEYTDKPSLYSLHPVWQLIHKDFSRNSTPSAQVYNEQGLPLKLKEEDTHYFQPFLQINPGPGYEFSYTCSD